MKTTEVSGKPRNSPLAIAQADVVAKRRQRIAFITFRENAGPQESALDRHLRLKRLEQKQ